MYLERFLQINVAVVVSLATLLLGMGERSITLPLWMLMIVVAAFWLTDVTGWFQLNRIVVNIASLIALVISFWGARRLESMVQLFAIANLLVYLQIILLFQKKEIRTYWQLLLVSLLQVVVAAAFNQEFWFGVLLFAYLLAGLTAMVLLFLHEDQSRPPQDIKPPTAADPRWPLAGPGFALAGAVSTGTGLVGELWVRLARMIVAIVVLTSVVFLTLPRVGTSGGWRQAAGAPLRSVGFSDEVTLGSFGRVVEDPEAVMQVRFVDREDGKIYPVLNEVYLRGAILTDYHRGRWRYPGRLSFNRFEPIRRDRLFIPARNANDVVVQKIVIEPLDRPELFCVWPFVPTGSDPRIQFDLRQQRILRRDDATYERFQYELGTTAFFRNEQMTVTPSDQPVRSRQYLQPVHAEGPDGLPGLIALARDWLERSSIEPDERFRIARLLELRLQRSERFRYSLEGQPRDPDLDPIEDFVTNHPAGHCEYFASALVLMLRSQGVPARMVVGYKTDEWNQFGGFFQVRQLHAHTWVEAYLEPDDVPPSTIGNSPGLDWSAGAWYRLDPTPSGSQQMSLSNRLMTRFDKYLFFLDYLWNNYITDMDPSRQRDTVYQPTMEALKNTGRNLLDPAWWRQWIRSLFEIDVNRWFRWQVGLVSMVVMLVFVLAWQGLRRMLPWLTVELGWSRAATARATTRVEFYRRLEAILARRGLVRAPSQTQREFAHRARLHLAQSTGDMQLAQLPVDVAEAFYRVRFGRLSLDKSHAEGVEQALKRLAIDNTRK
ncbi:MAG: DUF3488 domain-containing transglutaminase family protein [Rhodopirellula sp.]|nr:DUF3488 domain-containing transglutaminase family protein [Rhodopirellula sp.]